MDHFGIGAAMEGLVRVYCQAARHTGRTVSLVESVKDGDRVVCLDGREAERLRRLFKERGVAVTCMVGDPRQPWDMLRHGVSDGRTILDHTWVEQFYLDAMTRTKEELQRLEQELSGFGVAHRETRRKAIELSKWRG